MLKDEIWISDNERIQGYPCVFDHKRDGAVSYTRTSLIAAKDAEIAALERALEREVTTRCKLAAENDRLVQMLAVKEIDTMRPSIGCGIEWEHAVTQEIQRIREELREGGE